MQAIERSTGGNAAVNTHPSKRIAWVEPDESLVALCHKRVARMLKTRGLYYFWGRAEAKKRIYNAVLIDGRPLSYQGTGSEYFYSFLAFAGVLALLSLLVLGLVVYVVLYGEPPKMASITWPRYAAVVPTIFLLGIIYWRSVASELERTRWAGSAFKLTGSPWRYASLHLATLLALPLTLGWIIPFRQIRLKRELLGAVRCGASTCAFDGSARLLYRQFAVIWLGTILVYFCVVLVLSHTIGPAIVNASEQGNWSALLSPHVLPWLIGSTALGLLTFGFLQAWYRACTLNALAPNVLFGDARLVMHLPPLRYAANAMICTAIRFGSLTLYAPVADARAMRFVVRHTDLLAESSRVQFAGQDCAIARNHSFAAPATSVAS